MEMKRYQMIYKIEEKRWYNNLFDIFEEYIEKINCET